MSIEPHKLMDSPMCGERFVFNKEQVETIYQFLDHNEWDVIKVFDCVWREVFPESNPSQAGRVLDLVDKIATLKKLVGRSPERIWNQMIQAAKDGCYERVHLRPIKNHD